MLNKLIKYDIRATARIILPIFLGLGAITVLSSVVFGVYAAWGRSDNMAFAGIAMLGVTMAALLLIVAVIAVIIVALVYNVVYFFKNLLGDEGYLMFTLPVDPAAHIGSKLIVTVMWLFATAIVIGLCAIIVIFGISLGLGNMSVITNAISEIGRGLLDLIEDLRLSKVAVILELTLYVVTSTVYGVMTLFVSIALGQTVAPRHRLLGSVGMYAAISVMMQILTGGLQLSFVLFGTADSVIGGRMSHAFVIGFSLLAFLMSAGEFFIARWCFSKRLNLA